MKMFKKMLQIAFAGLLVFQAPKAESGWLGRIFTPKRVVVAAATAVGGTYWFARRAKNNKIEELKSEQEHFEEQEKKLEKNKKDKLAKRARIHAVILKNEISHQKKRSSFSFLWDRAVNIVCSPVEKIKQNKIEKLKRQVTELNQKMVGLECQCNKLSDTNLYDLKKKNVLLNQISSLVDQIQELQSKIWQMERCKSLGVALGLWRWVAADPEVAETKVEDLNLEKIAEESIEG